MPRPALPLAALLALWPFAAAAQDGPRGIAFVQAPEMASGVATGLTPEEGFAGATAGCMEAGAHPDDCIPTTWCLPAGWSIDLFVQHEEGVHWHENYCGLPSAAMAERMAGMLCDRGERPWLIECALVQMWDPDGTPMMEW